VVDFASMRSNRHDGPVLTVGLVLGAGGVVGGAYHAGALTALAEATGWDARDADLIVGTSAGSIAAASLRAGLSPADHFARMTGRPLSDDGAALVGHISPVTTDELPARAPFPRGLPLPASPQLAATALLPPWNARPMAALAGLLPAGSVPTAPIGDRIRTLFTDGWPERPMWICALRLRDGARVVFGRDECAPDVGTAVEASSAIPGFLQPVPVDGETYVDGGAHSPTNADLAAGLGLDVVIVISTMSSQWTALRPVPSMGSRALASWVLDREVRAIRASGSRVLVFEPTADDLAVMGTSPMDPDKRAAVAEQARSTTIQRLEHPAAADLVARVRGEVPSP
jgi:NTE family protein